MPLPQEKLAESLKALGELQQRGLVAIRSADLSRTHRERLLKNGFLQEVMKGWYITSRPDEARGESTAWYASFWDFCAAYLKERFGEDWSLSPEQSLFLHTGNRAVPRQLLVRSPKARNAPTTLAHDTSIFETRASLPPKNQRETLDGLNVFSLPAALVACGSGLFQQNATDARTALSMVRDASDILAILLEGGHSVIAGRLAGAFRNIGADKIADEIVGTMRAADYDVREHDPFETKEEFAPAGRSASPYVTRIRLSWQSMRAAILDAFPEPPGLTADKEGYLRSVDEIYVADAYHSLSIEGYRVSPALIERVRGGNWNPDDDDDDRQQRDAMAARGYYDAFRAVKNSVERVLSGENPGAVIDDDHSTWYRELFAPSVRAGILKSTDLAGYRRAPVFIRHSKHVPPRHDAVRDLMPEFFELLKEESEPAVRVVLGHFMLVYIHPYMDGNGRIGRFLMNVMMSAGGYPWTVVPVEQRNEYVGALETASVEGDIEPFALFLAELVRQPIATMTTK